MLPMTSEATSPRRKWLPTLQGYNMHQQLPGDVVAGITVASLAIPQSVAYASLAGCPAVVGLRGDLQVAYPVLGASRRLVVGPVAVVGLMTKQTLSQLSLKEMSEDWVDAAAVLCVLVAGVQIVASFVGVGRRFAGALSEAALKGFTLSAGFTIMETQMGGLLGIHGKFTLRRLDDTDYRVVLASVAGLVWLGLFPLLMLRISRGPSVVTLILSKLGQLSLLIVTAIIVWSFDLQKSIDTVGYVPRGWPVLGESLWRTIQNNSLWNHLAEHVSAWDWVEFTARIIGISLVGFIEAFAIANAADEEADLEADTELRALGTANAWTGLIGSFPVTGSFSRTAVNAEAGASSAISAGVAALVIAILLQTMTGPIAYVPKFAVACVVLAAVMKILDFDYAASAFVLNRRLSNGEELDMFERVMYWSTAFVGIAVSVEAGLAVGVALTALRTFKLV